MRWTKGALPRGTEICPLSRHTKILWLTKVDPLLAQISERGVPSAFFSNARPKPKNVTNTILFTVHAGSYFRRLVRTLLSCLRVVSVDLTQADKDPVIQIANVVKVQGSDDVVAKNVFTLGGCTSIVGAHVITNDTEDELLWEVGRQRVRYCCCPRQGRWPSFRSNLVNSTELEPLLFFS